jgi:uncharacterized protein (UPF0261 family)
MIAITVSDATRPITELAAAKLRALGHRVQFFEADGVGGPAMEALIRAGEVTAVLDLTPSELITHPHPDRLTAAGLMGVPQVISLGGLEGSPEVLDTIGKEIAEKASAAKGPTRVLVPAGTDRVLTQALRNWVYPPSRLLECDCKITDEEFAFIVLNELTALMAD